MRVHSVAVVFGTRPEVVKLAPVLWALGDRARTIHTGQHYDPALSDALLAELGLAPPGLRLEIGGASRGTQLGTATSLLDRAFAAARPDVVVVQGDTNSTLAGAIAANSLDIPLVHVEAGLRSYDRTMPEEHNRVLTDHLADLCCAPTDTSRKNLEAEGITGARVVVTGNTVVDAAAKMMPDEHRRADLLDHHGLSPDAFVLSTFHRPENVDDDVRLRSILDQLNALPLPVVLPMHPRTRARLEATGSGAVGAVRVIEPIGYREFLGLARESAFLVSDSGGVQEEASIVKRPVLVVRASTERPEVIGTFAELVPPGESIAEHGRTLAADAGRRERLARLPSPYGDGHAGERIAAEIAALVA
jgi:UDP-N-acetylglucosamine 2-epimerase (non-hydrolysing)